MRRKNFIVAVVIGVLLAGVFAPSLREESYAAAKVKGNWINYAAKGFAGGKGTKNDPYRISSASQLAFLAKQTNKGAGKYSGANYKLTKDIDLSAHNWTPIGTYSKRFYGALNGDKHTIKGLTIKGNVRYAGLFGVAENSSRDEHGPPSLSHINMADVDIDTSYYAGAIAGYSESGYISNCEITGSVKAGKSAGGLIGASDGSAFDMINVQAKVRSGGYAGGLTGKWEYSEKNNTGDDNEDEGDNYESKDNVSCVYDCTVGGSIEGKDYVGGMIGRVDTYDKDVPLVRGHPKWGEVYFGSEVNAKVSGRNYVGGFIGRMGWTGYMNEDKYLYYTYYHAFPDSFIDIDVRGSVTGRKNVGGIFGYDQDHLLANCNFSGKVKGSENTGGLIGFANDKAPLGPPGYNSLDGKISECYAVASVTGGNNTGGLVGNLESEKDKYTIEKSFFSGNVKGVSAVTGGLIGGAYMMNEFTLINSYANGSVSGKANTGGLFGVFDEKDIYRVILRESYVSVAVKGTKGSTGYIFGKPFRDRNTNIKYVYYEKAKAKDNPHGIRMTDDNGFPGFYSGDPTPVTNAQLAKKKLRVLDYREIWSVRMEDGKYMYYPELKVFAKSEKEAIRADSKKGARTAAYYKVTYYGGGGKTADGKSKATQYVRYNNLKKTKPPTFIRKGYKMKGITAMSPKKLPKQLKDNKTKVKIKWIKAG